MAAATSGVVSRSLDSSLFFGIGTLERILESLVLALGRTPSSLPSDSSPSSSWGEGDLSRCGRYSVVGRNVLFHCTFEDFLHCSISVKRCKHISLTLNAFQSGLVHDQVFRIEEQTVTCWRYGSCVRVVHYYSITPFYSVSRGGNVISCIFLTPELNTLGHIMD